MSVGPKAIDLIELDVLTGALRRWVEGSEKYKDSLWEQGDRSRHPVMEAYEEILDTLNYMKMACNSLELTDTQWLQPTNELCDNIEQLAEQVRCLCLLTREGWSTSARSGK